LTGIAPVDLPQKDSRIQFAERVNLQSNLLNWIEIATEVSIEKRFDSARDALDCLQLQAAKKISIFQSNKTRKQI
jgi:hypothetical protein